MVGSWTGWFSRRRLPKTGAGWSPGWGGGPTAGMRVILHRDGPADTLHLIAAGHVSVRVTPPGGEFAIVAILGPATPSVSSCSAAARVPACRPHGGG
jgi:hypothetical protein